MAPLATVAIDRENLRTVAPFNAAAFMSFVTGGSILRRCALLNGRIA